MRAEEKAVIFPALSLPPTWANLDFHWLDELLFPHPGDFLGHQT